MLARWTWRLRPWQALALAPLWVALTSLTEYFLILPWLQPKLAMQTPYWINLLVHIGSAPAYPLFFLWRRLVAGRGWSHAGFGRAWAVVLAGILAVFAFGGLLTATGREPVWPFNTAASQAADQAYLRSMAAHHQAGAALARLAAERAERDDLRALGQLMAAEQQAELEQMANLWWNWYGGDLPAPTPAEQATLPGLPPAEALTELAQLEGRVFEARFLTLMIAHHQDAITLATDAIARTRDPRLILFADNVRHPQRKQLQALEDRRQGVAPER